MKAKLKISDQVRDEIEQARDEIEQARDDLETAELALERVIHGLTIHEQVEDDDNIPVYFSKEELIELLDVLMTRPDLYQIEEKLSKARWNH